MLSGTQIPDKSTLPSSAWGVGPEGGAGGLRVTTGGTPFLVWPINAGANSVNTAIPAANKCTTKPRRICTAGDLVAGGLAAAVLLFLSSATRPVFISQSRRPNAPDPDYSRYKRTLSFRSSSQAWKFC